MTNRENKKVACSMEDVASKNADELETQFRTLNHFASHGGEIGRAHEYYLRGVLLKYLPNNLRLGSGFIASQNWTSRQQDILIYQRDFTTLFKAGDCVVVDYDALVGTVEVKTNLNSTKKFVETLEKISELEGRYRNRGLRALYAWDGLKSNTALKALWQFIREDPTNRSSRLPHLIYVRGKYLLMANDENDARTHPFSLWRIGKECLTEGQALLGLVFSVWKFGISMLPPHKPPPWWLLSWHSHYGHLPTKSKQIEWPPDLAQIVESN